MHKHLMAASTLLLQYMKNESITEILFDFLYGLNWVNLTLCCF